MTTPKAKRDGACRELDPIDLTPCVRCGLRGHLAGDPDRCTSGVEMYGHADGGGEYVGRRQR
jgi:hypothetical protein